MSNLDLEALRSVSPTTEAERANIQSRLETQRPPFVSKKNVLAILSFGGTIQSAYDPNQENIVPVAMNPALERAQELAECFGVTNDEMTGTVLVTKDSRHLTNADAAMLIHTIQEIENERVLVTCGTYLLPVVAQILDFHFGGKDRIIGVTGSSLPPSHKAQDVDYNIGGTIAAINAFDAMKEKMGGGNVFAQFHGQIITGKELANLNLHLSTHKPRFARASVDTR